jgi:hypothetical protein
MPLFKYCGVSGAMVLKNLEIKATPPNEFNDPFEFSPVVRTDDPKARARRDAERVVTHPAFFELNRGSFQHCGTFAEFQKFARENIGKVQAMLEAATPQLDTHFQSEVLDTLSRKFGVVCFSADPTDPLMWGHYAASHTGLVIEFDANDALFNNPSFLKVDYLLDRVYYNPSDGANEAAVAAFARRKSPHWSYEQESRLIIDLSLTRKVAGTPPVFLFSIKPELLKSVTLGLRSSAAIRAEVLALASAPPLQHMDVFQMEADAKEFKLHRKKLKQP